MKKMYWLLEKKGEEVKVTAVRQTLEELAKEIIANPKQSVAAEELNLEKEVKVSASSSKVSTRVNINYDLPQLTESNYFFVLETYKYGEYCPENFKRTIKEYSTSREAVEKLVEESRIKPKTGYGREVKLLKPIKLNVTYTVKTK